MKHTILVALAVLGLSIAAQPIAVQAAAKAVTVGGTAKSVAADSLVVTVAGKDMTFKVDGTTKFIAKGLSTKAAKGKITATDAVGMNDMVRVTYHDMGGGVMHAATVRVTTKAMPAKK